MYKITFKIFKKVKHAIRTAVLQDGIQLMESHLTGLNTDDTKQNKKETYDSRF
ncbi:hypothetical protein SPE26_23335 [Bacillus thuringiensis]|uniref:Uncharacterized protein n=1 Tax=Bacillus thuringiensis TaxID=1428 RepID=A0AAW9GSK5_BACTU|nr:hypothetical protein [Bacillus thuringiensis]MDY0854362.1 hypothetical protein [Bacillus thuringiensis]MDY4393648.1 hypothetical protein [Bacillus thuringiensis]